MKAELTFSIVTPSYNQGEFLAETIESVLGQAGDFAIDYLIVDGGSTDRSVEVIREYQRRLDQGEWPVRCREIRYRWLSEKDAGQTDALGKGFRMAEGDIFAWLNSDDTYLPGALQAVAERFEEGGDTALLYGDAQYCDARGEVIGRYRTQSYDYGKLAWFNFICQPAAFFRKEAFLAVGGLDATLHFAMDYDLWVRIARRFPCRYLPKPLANYRLHETSKTVSDRTLIANCEEAERLALKYFGWAPLTRVYNTCSARCRANLPNCFAASRVALLAAVGVCTIARSLRLNRGIRLRDLALLNRENFGKLGKSRLEIMTGNKDQDC
ncbi:glycosyltransferase family 2 protein [Geomesophilobacter sediminis]|uniref:Glycosyltransferase n=1 Tax=Geomesophilobacter sediminis TaxID=2798584 RepID=A0A8J7S814_9BACT|nr:glycosyltransferase family 2 protein [Geomesophilobacter sediminis]MBJ6727297.1 glycosyltransferase [Geomesophilobacter sediminis]